MTHLPLRLFALDDSVELGDRVAAELGRRLDPIEVRQFEDGEHKTRPLVSVRGADVFVLCGLHGDPGVSANDKLIRLLFFLATLRDAAAQRVTAVIPYLAYARKDRRTKPRDPLNTRYLAQLIESTGCDRVLLLDTHNPAAVQNAFRCVSEHLQAKQLFASYFDKLLGSQALVVVSPDSGGVKRADALRVALEQLRGEQVTLAYMAKIRSSGAVTTHDLAGDIEGRCAIVVDDLISTGGTLRRAAEALRARGATGVYAAATHGLFMAAARQQFASDVIDHVVVTDSVPLSAHRVVIPSTRLTALSCAPLMAAAIRALNENGSVVDLMGP